MKRSAYFAYGFSAIALAALFQNCSPGDFSGSQAKSLSSVSSSTASPISSSSSSGSIPILPGSPSSITTSSSSMPDANAIKVFASGNAITTNKGQTINFLNLQGLSIGTASITNTQSSFTVALVNTPSGRTASVKVYVDTSGKFLKVVQDSKQPYMCHDQNASICAQYPNATSGQMESNCQSPILYNGALTGSVNNLTTTAFSSVACSESPSSPAATPAPTASAQVCSISYAHGGSIQTQNISQADCLSACQNNQRSNPSETLTCLYNNQIISTGASSSSASACGGSQPAGTAVNTITDSSGQSNYQGLQCGQANKTALLCRSCSATWSYPHGSYIGAQIQCVCN